VLGLVPTVLRGNAYPDLDALRDVLRRRSHGPPFRLVPTVLRGNAYPDLGGLSDAHQNSYMRMHSSRGPWERDVRVGSASWTTVFGHAGALPYHGTACERTDWLADHGL